MSESDEKNVESKLRQIIETFDAANAINDPLTGTIVNLLETSSAVLNSEEASVLIRDGSEGDLKFLCAIGQVANQLIGLKVPAGKGIAGFVFSSGQPMAITDVGEEESFYAEVDKQTGFSTQTILATPLIYEGVSIGVLEYINRIGEPPYEAFSPEEMNTAAIYADAIAGVVNAYEAAKLLENLSRKIFSAEEAAEFSEIKKWVNELKDTTHHKDLIELALLVQKISHRGAAERRLCKEILESFVNYTDNNLDSRFNSL